VILTEEQWVDFRLLFETVHPGDINRANQKFDNLTPADLRFVLLTRLGLGNKEMATMLGVGPEAIRVARYRLLRKIRLPEGASLEETVLAV
ncbi:MAG: hypothetical protein K8F30_13945, partial [Taibaiella sp.]|nr:hypothetical protein [Taibaiella sp.]